ncbi:MAG: hypothetical protein AAF741_08850 [Bacteroidota bacterium]
MAVTIQKKEDKIVITLPATIATTDLQKGLSYFKFIDIVGRSEASPKDIDELVRSVKSSMSRPVIEKLRELDEFKDL